MVDLYKHNGVMYFLVKKTIDVKIYLSDDNKAMIVVDRYETVVAEITYYNLDNDIMLHINE